MSLEIHKSTKIVPILNGHVLILTSIKSSASYMEGVGGGRADTSANTVRYTTLHNINQHQIKCTKFILYSAARTKDQAVTAG